MATQIHPVTPIFDGLGDATRLRIGFDHDRPHRRAALQLEGCGQAGGAGSDDHGCL